MASFELSPRETFADNITRLTRERLARVLAATSGGAANGGDTAAAYPAGVAVHESRKDLKRLRAVLRLARAGLGEAVFRRENVTCRDAGRALSAVRDAQVLVGAFDGLKNEFTGQIAPETLERLRRLLLDNVRASRAAARQDGRLPRAVARLGELRERVDGWPWRGGRDGWRVPGEGLRRVYRAGRRAMRRAAANAAAGDFHEWRKQVKHLAAHVHLLCPMWPGPLRALGKELDKLADRLGNEHDLAVLLDTLTRQPDPAVPPDDLTAVGRVIGGQQAEHRHKALKLGRRLYRERPGHFARRWRGCWGEWKHPAGAEIGSGR